MTLTPLKQLETFSDFHVVCNHFGIEINNNQLDIFKRYYEILLDWNKKINLVSRGVTCNASTILEKHFLDSILFLPEMKKLVCHSLSPISLFDIGSGGGFPGVPLAIMIPEWEFVLCESITKKANFLNLLIKELCLEKSVKIINARVETYSHASLLQKKYNIVTARAVGKIDLLTKYAMPLLTKDGLLISYKAKEVTSELKNIKQPYEIYSKEIYDVERKLVVIRF